MTLISVGVNYGKVRCIYDRVTLTLVLKKNIATSAFGTCVWMIRRKFLVDWC